VSRPFAAGRNGRCHPCGQAAARQADRNERGKREGHERTMPRAHRAGH
jgi:hypothetical protein